MSAPLGARSQKLYTTTKQTGMTRRKKTALMEGASNAQGFQDFCRMYSHKVERTKNNLVTPQLIELRTKVKSRDLENICIYI